MSMPGFTKDRTLHEQVLNLERVREAYEKSSGRDLPDDLTLSVLVKALPANICNHVQLSMAETSDYASVRSMVLSYGMCLQHGGVV